MRKRRPDYKRRKNFTRKRFSFKNIDPTLITVIVCILGTLVFAIILGNILGDKAHASQNEQGDQQNDLNYQTSLPKPSEQGSRVPVINAFSVDMTTAQEGVSLSEQTASARSVGNALFVPIKTQNGNIIYSSDKTADLGVSANSNLTLNRLCQHFQYYDDYVCGYFKSDFNPYNSAENCISTRAKEHTLLVEAKQNGFSELIIEFKLALTSSNVVDFYSYMLDLKLALPSTPIGIYLSQSFCESPDSSALIAQMMAVADFFVVDLSASSPDAIESALSSLSYLATRYPCRVVLTCPTQEALEQAIALLGVHSIGSFIVK